MFSTCLTGYKPGDKAQKPCPRHDLTEICRKHLIYHLPIDSLTQWFLGDGLIEGNFSDPKSSADVFPAKVPN